MFMLLRRVFLSKVDLGALEYKVHPGVPLKIYLIYAGIYCHLLELYFFFQSQNGLLLGIGGSAVALWDSFVCPVFTDGLVYGYPGEVGKSFVIFVCLQYSVFLCLGSCWGTSWTGIQVGVRMEYIQISIARLHYLYPVCIILLIIPRLK